MDEQNTQDQPLIIIEPNNVGDLPPVTEPKVESHPRTEMTIALERLEHMTKALEGYAVNIENALKPVLMPVDQKGGEQPNTVTPSSPVPLAAIIHAFADRLAGVVDAEVRILERVHV